MQATLKSAASWTFTRLRAPVTLTAVTTCMLTCLFLAGCGAPWPLRSSIPVAAKGTGGSVPRFHHVFLLVLENREYNPGGDPQFLQSMAAKGASPKAYYAISHPSLPNYLALLSGSTFGVHDDSLNHQFSAATLVDQLDGAKLTWKAYMEGMPTPCYRGPFAGLYVERHDPFMFFSQIRDNIRRCSKVQPMFVLFSNLKAGAVPNFVWITPDLCSDGHSCGNDAVSRFLARVIPAITATRAYRDHGVIFVTHDEGATHEGCCRYAGGGHVGTVIIGDGVRGGARSTIPSDHYSLLKTIEDGFGLPHLGGASCRCTPTLGWAWKR